MKSIHFLKNWILNNLNVFRSLEQVEDFISQVNLQFLLLAQKGFKCFC